MRLLLFSNSTNAGEEYLGYTLPYIDSFLPLEKRKAAFIPYAGISVGFDKYAEMVSDQLTKVGIEIISLHNSTNKKKTIEEADIIIIGGGNTFFLLKSLQEENLLGIIRTCVLEGTPYIGWSAGSNMACPTIKTTNDMPIVEPANFYALNLISFQINPHYTDFKQEDHAGETREMRILEFLLANQDVYVTGLREHTLLQIEEGKIELKGTHSCRIFKKGMPPIEIQPGEDLDILLQ